MSFFVLSATTHNGPDAIYERSASGADAFAHAAGIRSAFERASDCHGS